MTLPTDKVKVGMEVASDVLNLNQVLLVSQGTLLTERHLRVLRAWGIGSIPVVGDDETLEEQHPPRQPQFAPEILERAETQVVRRLRHVSLDSSAVRTIRELAILHTARQIAQAAATSPTPAKAL